MLRVIPLGGLGEIGLNSMVIECRDERVLIDCGLMFPTAEMPGVDIVVPDFGFLRSQPDRLKAVVLTHGHEDHVGALPFLLRDFKVPVFGTKLTLALVRHRLDEMGIAADLHEVSPRELFTVGTLFSVEPVRVAHSIPDGVALILRTPDGTVVHTGDFKIDEAPIDGRGTDLQRLGEVGDEGVLCLMSDSTNSETEDLSGDEVGVAAAFERLFARATGRVVISMFASNLNRAQHVLDLAARSGRKVALQGRSMVRNIELASELGYLKVPKDTLISADAGWGLPGKKLVVLSTGSQAEPRSGLVQMVADDSNGPQVGKGDLVVLSSRPIPGNDRAITSLIDRLYQRGADVAYARIDPGVHVSGHAGRSEQRKMIQTVRPSNFLPIHGEARHLHHHLDVARGCGIGGLVLAQDGDVISFEQGKGAVSGSVPHGRIFRERFGGGSMLWPSLKERLQLAETGLVVAVAAIDRTTLSVVHGPTLHGRGLAEEDQAQLPAMAEEARALFLELSPALRQDDALVKEELVRAVRRAFRNRSQKRPTVLPILVRL